MGIARDFHALWVKYERLTKDFTQLESKYDMVENLAAMRMTTIGDLQDQMNREVRDNIKAINKYEERRSDFLSIIDDLRAQLVNEQSEVKRLNAWIDAQFGEGVPEVDNRIELIDPPEPEVSDVEVDATTTFGPRDNY